ncbi:MAG: hypothetical protein R3Y28_02855 [Candidatus Gastranaerophilales bacterium]
MKINSIERNMQRVHGDSAPLYTSQNLKERYSTGMLKNNDEYNANNSGNFTSKSEVAAVSFEGNKLDAFYKSKAFNKALDLTQKYHIATTNFVILIMSAIFRPLAIMALPDKKDDETKDEKEIQEKKEARKEDKVYAAAHSIASGVIGFGIATAISAPLDVAIKKMQNNEEIFNKSEYVKKLKETAKSGKTQIEKNTAERTMKAMDMFLKNIPDWFIVLPKGFLTVALIPPILKYGFGMDKKKKEERVTLEFAYKNNNEQSEKMDDKSNLKWSMDDFSKGGSK